MLGQSNIYFSWVALKISEREKNDPILMLATDPIIGMNLSSS
jgi:hypothetical protein